MEQEKEQAAVDNAAIDNLQPAVERFKVVFKSNRERADKAITVSKAITQVSDGARDAHANAFLVKAGKTYEEIKEARLTATRIIDDAKQWAMVPEKELKAEIDRIVKLRNEYAQKIANQKAEEEKKIQQKKAYDTHEGEVKARMKMALELGLGEKIAGLEATIAKMFNDATMQSYPALVKTLDTVKPGLKPDFYENVFRVDYDKNIMTDEQFEGLLARAKAYEAWKFDRINQEYVKTAGQVIDKWKEKLPQRKRELEKIANGDAAAKEAAENRAKSEEAKRKAEEDKKKKEIESRKAEEAGKAALDAEFEAQKKAQDLGDQEGTRTKKVFRIASDVEADPVKLAALLSKVFLNIATEPGYSLYSGKKNDEGDLIYISYIDDMLKALQKLKYAPSIDGLIVKEIVKTVAQIKK